MRSDIQDRRAGPVLVVDDEPDILTFVRLALEDEGYGVVTARNGSEALDVAGATNPSLILLDLRMPGMGGREFVQEYRTRESRGGTAAPEPPKTPVPIILVTASRLPEVDPEEIGATGVLRKPFEVERLLESVARYVRGAGELS